VALATIVIRGGATIVENVEETILVITEVWMVVSAVSVEVVVASMGTAVSAMKIVGGVMAAIEEELLAVTNEKHCP